MLVITIIVMIILATVVILSLDSSNIIERANEAKKATNLANLKEAANVALAEYKLEVSLGNLDGKATSANSYVKNKLEEQGMDTSTMTVTEDEKILTGLTEVAVKFIESEVEVGATVTGYDLSSNTKTTYATTGRENTKLGNPETDTTTQDISRASTLTWKYMGMNDEGKVLIVANSTGTLSSMTMSGRGGYLYGPNELDLACDALYSSDMGKARSIDINDVNTLLETTPVGVYTNTAGNSVKNTEGLTIGEIISQKGETALSGNYTPDRKSMNTYVPSYYEISKSSVGVSDTIKSIVYQSTTYWLASPSVEVAFGSFAWFGVRTVDTGVVQAVRVYNSDDGFGTEVYAIRPVVELASDVGITVNADGSVTLN